MSHAVDHVMKFPRPSPSTASDQKLEV